MKKSAMLKYMILGNEISPKKMWNFFINYMAFVTKRPKALG